MSELKLRFKCFKFGDLGNLGEQQVRKERRFSLKSTTSRWVRLPNFCSKPFRSLLLVIRSTLNSLKRDSFSAGNSWNLHLFHSRCFTWENIGTSDNVSRFRSTNRIVVTLPMQSKRVSVSFSNSLKHIKTNSCICTWHSPLKSPFWNAVIFRMLVNSPTISLLTCKPARPWREECIALRFSKEDLRISSPRWIFAKDPDWMYFILFRESTNVRLSLFVSLRASRSPLEIYVILLEEKLRCLREVRLAKYLGSFNEAMLLWPRFSSCRVFKCPMGRSDREDMLVSTSTSFFSDVKPWKAARPRCWSELAVKIKVERL